MVIFEISGFDYVGLTLKIDRYGSKGRKPIISGFDLKCVGGSENYGHF